MNVTKDKWERLWRAMKMRSGNKSLEPIAALRLLNVCPNALITPLSWELFNLYKICEGFKRIMTPADYYNLPALYTAAVIVIDSERAKFEDKKDG